MRSSPTESQYAARLRQALRERYGPRLWMLKVHGGAFQTGGAPDLLLCLGGCFIALELKRPNGKMTPRQAATAQQILTAGGEVLVVRTNEPIDEVIRRVESAKRTLLSTMQLQWNREVREHSRSQREGPALPMPNMREEISSTSPPPAQ